MCVHWPDCCSPAEPCPVRPDAMRDDGATSCAVMLPVKWGL